MGNHTSSGITSSSYAHINPTPTKKCIFNQPTPQWMIHYSHDVNELHHKPIDGSLKLILMPQDHSCLYHAINYTCNGQDFNEKGMMIQRMRASQYIATHSDKYNDVILNYPHKEYCNSILHDTVWGSSVELSVFSEYYQCEIFVFDLNIPTLYTFGTNEEQMSSNNNDAGNQNPPPHYNKRVYLVYSGNHYDVLVYKPNKHLNVKPLDSNGKVKKCLEYFSTHDIGILQQMIYMIERLSTHYKRSLHMTNAEYGAERRRYELLETSWDIGKRNKRILQRYPPSPIKSTVLHAYMQRTESFYIHTPMQKLKLPAIAEAEDDDETRDEYSETSASTAPSTTQFTQLTDGCHSPKISNTTYHHSYQLSTDLSNDSNDHSVISNISSTSSQSNTPTYHSSPHSHTLSIFHSSTTSTQQFI